MTAEDFVPYFTYRRRLRELDEFRQLTELSYGLAQQLLFQTPLEQLGEEIQKRHPPSKLSFGPGDQEVRDVALVCEWVDFDEYARRSVRDPAAVADAAQSGQLGPVEKHPATSESLLIWPPDCQQRPREELPTPGKKKFRVSVDIFAQVPVELDNSDLSAFEATQRVYLRLAHALGEPDTVSERASQMLNRATFLLEWNAFELYLRQVASELIRREPERLWTGKRGAETVTLSDLVALSENFSNTAALRDRLAARTVERAEQDGASVHGLINLLKASYQIEPDPYQSWFVISGKRHVGSYNELLAIKETRNALVHEDGRVSTDFATKFPSVSVNDGMVQITDDFRLRSQLFVRAIAHSIASAVAKRSAK